MFTITISIIVLTCLVSYSAFKNPKLMEDLSFLPPAVKRGQYYRFLTSALVHADFIHLAFNMVSLYFLGRVMEAYYMGVLGLPHYYYLILYVGAVIVANIPSFVKQMNNENYLSLGASGGVCAVIFAFILLRPWEELTVFFIPMPAIVYAFLFLGYSIYMGKKGGDNVNHDAHFWGALFGIVFTIGMRPDVINIFLNELKHPHYLGHYF